MMTLDDASKSKLESFLKNWTNKHIERNLLGDLINLNKIKLKTNI